MSSRRFTVIHHATSSLYLVLLCSLSVVSEPSGAASRIVIAQWNFNSNSADGDTRTGTTIPSLGSGSAASVGSVSQLFFTGSPSDPASDGGDNSGWSISSFPPQGTGNKQEGVQFNVSTSGKRNIVITWVQRVSPTASRYSRLQYSTNQADFIDFASPVVLGAADIFESQVIKLVEIAGVNDNANFACTVVTEFESTAIGSGNNNYVTASMFDYITVGRLRFDMVTVSGEVLAPTLSSPTYSTNGGFRLDLAGASEASYAVQASTNLIDWVSLGTNVPPFHFTDAGAGILPNRFYRAVYLP
jgi:hypothetical protein